MKSCLYKSTRSNDTITASEAIVRGLAHDGGLYVPVEFPVIDKSMDELKGYNYRELAFYIMEKYFTDFEEDELKECINNAYDDKFDNPQIAPLVERGGAFFLELYHGPTLAFKDMALSILPHLLKTACKKINLDKEIVILTATSGDTGKAALEGFADVEGTKIIVFFPKDGVSQIQKRQMVTQEGANTHVVAIEGNFDDAQRAVKEVFNDREFNGQINERGYMFSSANSINVGRLVPQIVYYFYAYLNLLREGRIQENERINICVPTGNFGNILAAYYAKKMGLPVNKLICASNENNVLYDFFDTGIYDKKREFKKTISPSMDILVSSNLERFLYEIGGHDEGLIKDLMEQLNKQGEYEITSVMKEGLKDFYGGYCNDDETYETIKRVYDDTGYLIDTHTAVAYYVYKKYREETGDNTKTVIASTASPFKFTRSVIKALNPNYDRFDDFKLIEVLSELTGLEIPKAIKDIDKKEILHTRICTKEEIKAVISEILSK